MVFVETSRIALLNLAAFQPAFQETLTIQLNGIVLLLIFMVIGGGIGFQRGVRAILTIALMSVIAYIVAARGGEDLINAINRFYVNGPKLVAFAMGRDPAVVPPLDPLISGDVQVPLFFRVVLFIGLIALASFFNAKPGWYSKTPAKDEPLAPALGAFTGALAALIWVSAAEIFWSDYVANGGTLGGPVANILNILPDIGIFIPSLITIFFLLLIAIVVFYLPKVWNKP